MESAQCVSQLSVWELISDSMDRNRFGMSIIWTWSNLDSLDCCLQTFHVKNVAYMQFHSSNVNCFLFRGWCEVSFIWNKQKQQSRYYTWIESGPENVLRPNWSDVELERSRTRTWSCTSIRTRGHAQCSDVCLWGAQLQVVNSARCDNDVIINMGTGFYKPATGFAA